MGGGFMDVFLERVRQQPFADEAERDERLRSVQNRVVDLLDSWRKVFEDYRAAGVALQYQKYELNQPRPLLREVLDKAFESQHHTKIPANPSPRFSSCTRNHWGKRQTPIPRVVSRGSLESGGGAKSLGAATPVMI